MPSSVTEVSMKINQTQRPFATAGSSYLQTWFVVAAQGRVFVLA